VKSRFFSIPGLLVDVSEIVSIVYAEDRINGIVFRNGTQTTASTADLKSVQEYVEEYEAAMQAAWETEESPFLTANWLSGVNEKTGAKGG
jgi:hypothetical protein